MLVNVMGTLAYAQTAVFFRLFYFSGSFPPSPKPLFLLMFQNEGGRTRSTTACRHKCILYEARLGFCGCAFLFCSFRVCILHSIKSVYFHVLAYFIVKLTLVLAGRHCRGRLACLQPRYMLKRLPVSFAPFYHTSSSCWLLPLTSPRNQSPFPWLRAVR